MPRRKYLLLWPLISPSYGFKTDPEVNDPEIVVIGQRLEQQMTVAFVNFAFPLTANATAKIVSLCIGSTKMSEIASILSNMDFTVDNKDYEAGRAGQNNVGGSSHAVPVHINAEALKGYDARENGLGFLVGHETAHALKAMQTFNNKMWKEYIAGPGKDLSSADRIINYPSSTQFQRNEARANTVARALQQRYNSQPIVPDPQNGYEAC